MQTTQYNFIDYIASDCLEHLADKDKKRGPRGIVRGGQMPLPNQRQ